METVIQKPLIKKIIDESYIAKAMNYDEYRRLIDALIIVGRSTATKESESLLAYSKLNVSRMKRLDKTIEIIPELRQAIEKITTYETWLVLTEGWCGDAAQLIPLFAKIEQLNKNISLRFLLRDENLELMDAYLYNGKSRSIPKLIALNSNNEELFNFGPRPKVLQEWFLHMRANGVNNNTLKEELHKWYAKDKTLTTQHELVQLLNEVI